MMICPECKKREGMIETLRSEKAALQAKLEAMAITGVMEIPSARALLKRAEQAESEILSLKQNLGLRESYILSLESQGQTEKKGGQL